MAKNLDGLWSGVKEKTAVLYYAEWDAPGLQMVELCREFRKRAMFGVEWMFVDAEQCDKALCDEFQVTAVPTLCLLTGKKLWKKVEGADGEKFSEALKHFDEAEAPVPEDEEKDDRLTERLKQLTSTAPVMLFMKGAPEEPKCKFSRQAVDLLKNEDIDFASFDILRDNDVRQGLKVFSEWPTFPQLYVNGSFAGGIDILKEMASSEDESLKDQLNVQSKDQILTKRLEA